MSLGFVALVRPQIASNSRIASAEAVPVFELAESRRLFGTGSAAIELEARPESSATEPVPLALNNPLFNGRRAYM